MLEVMSRLSSSSARPNASTIRTRTLNPPGDWVYREPGSSSSHPPATDPETRTHPLITYDHAPRTDPTPVDWFHLEYTSQAVWNMQATNRFGDLVPNIPCSPPEDPECGFCKFKGIVSRAHMRCWYCRRLMCDACKVTFAIDTSSHGWQGHCLSTTCKQCKPVCRYRVPVHDRPYWY